VSATWAPAAAPTRSAQRLGLVSLATLAISGTLLFLNYRYVSATVDLDDVRNPYLAWAPWSRFALLLGGLLAAASTVLGVAGAMRKDAGVAWRIAAPLLLLANLAVLYARYEVSLYAPR